MEDESSVLARSLALCLNDDLELRAIVEIWQTLPEAIRAGIVAMVKAATSA